MKSKAACIWTLIRFVIFSVAACGCGETQTAGLNSATAVHKDAPSGDIHVVNVRCYHDGDELVISGKVRRGCNFSYQDVLGHIDIVVLDPEGSVLTTASTYYSPRGIPKTGSRSSCFSARLPATVGKDAVIRTAYHEDSDFAVHSPGEKAFHCRMNMALPSVQAATASSMNATSR